LFKDPNKASYQYKTIQDGDKIAVAVSGGKDSLTLLNLLDLHLGSKKVVIPGSKSLSMNCHCWSVMGKNKF